MMSLLNCGLLGIACFTVGYPSGEATYAYPPIYRVSAPSWHTYGFHGFQQDFIGQFPIYYGGVVQPVMYDSGFVGHVPEQVIYEREQPGYAGEVRYEPYGNFYYQPREVGLVSEWMNSYHETTVIYLADN